MPAWLPQEVAVADFRVDQAAGLRRMLGGGGLQVRSPSSLAAKVSGAVRPLLVYVALARLGRKC